MAAADRRTGTAQRRGRVVIEGVTPEIDCGRFPIRRVIGEEVVVEASVFVGGHESPACALLYRRRGQRRWTEVSMEPLWNDRWRASFLVTEPGRYQYTVLGWPAPFTRWRRELGTRIEAQQDIRVDLQLGAELAGMAARAAPEPDASRLRDFAELLGGPDLEQARSAAGNPELSALVAAHTSREQASRYERELEVVVDPVRALFSSWYELFPRSAAAQPGQHGTFRDVERWLPRIAQLGFDVLYMPPIHPIGTTLRKGRNNQLAAVATDPGSPWAIGSAEGGHKAIHAQLGTLEDFHRLVQSAHEHGLDIALDIAFQASPDHPYVKEHPDWFRTRPDGTIQYAENPPKKYQDIYPFDFESDDTEALWEELRGVFTYWIEQGVRIFRVDNPHTKPFPFWEWLIGTLKAKYPDVILLAEAFTRPAVMYRLAKVGFSQCYTYFAWRNSKWELMEYLQELTSSPLVEFFRPSLWPNTPDILTEPFVRHGEPVFKSRLILAATLSASYGIYGPPYEKMLNWTREPGSEEHLDSEKYQLKHWDFSEATPVSTLIERVNRIRRENAALQDNRTLRFHPIDSDQMIAYTKHSADFSNVILTVVNLDPVWRQGASVELPLEALGLSAERPYTVHDLLTGATYEWHGARNYVELDPQRWPAHILRIEQEPGTARG